MTIRSTSLRESARDAILELILAGHISPRSRLAVGELAQTLGVSATPVREALVGLCHEGFLEAKSNRGFFVVPRSLREVEELYVLISALEATAVEMQVPFPHERIERLRELNAKFLALKRSPSPERASALDREWHAELTRGCANRIVLETIASAKARATRYEQAYMRHSPNIQRSYSDHERITRSIQTDAARSVRTLLIDHWHRSVEFISAALSKDSEEVNP